MLAQPQYDLLLKGGHVIDGRNKISAVRDVAIRDGKIAAVAPNIPASSALKTVDVSGLYVTPGIVDIHVHVYTGHRRAQFLRRRQQRLPRRLHVPRRRDDRRGCGRRRLAQLRGLQGQGHRPLQDQGAGDDQHRRQRHARRQVGAGLERHGSQAHRRHGAEVQGTDRGGEVRALLGTGVGAIRAWRRGGAESRISRSWSISAALTRPGSFTTY